MGKRKSSKDILLHDSSLKAFVDKAEERKRQVQEVEELTFSQLKRLGSEGL
ncbi:MAG: hypothetical protein ABIH34_06570 [Nanoarchaeota archaeon]